MNDPDRPPEDSEVSKLLRRLEDPDRAEIWEAAKSLSSLLTDIQNHLARLLTESRNVDARAAAAYALGWCGWGINRSALEDALKSEKEDAVVRDHAAEALGLIGNRESVGALLAHLDNSEPGIRYSCIYALGQIGDPSALGPLQTIADKEVEEFYESYSIREGARIAIATIRSKSESNLTL